MNFAYISPDLLRDLLRYHSNPTAEIEKCISIELKKIHRQRIGKIGMDNKRWTKRVFGEIDSYSIEGHLGFGRTFLEMFTLPGLFEDNESDFEKHLKLAKIFSTYNGKRFGNSVIAHRHSSIAEYSKGDNLEIRNGNLCH